MTNHILDLPTDSHSADTDSPARSWTQTFRSNLTGYSSSIVTTLITAGAVGAITGSVAVLLPFAATVVALAVVAHIRLSISHANVERALNDAEEKLAKEASSSRILGGIRVLRGSNSLSPDARLASAARMATEYPAAIVFNLREAHGVLAPSNWNYEGQLAHIRDAFEPVDGDDAGATAARQGSAIVISDTDQSSIGLPKWAEQAGFRQGIVTPIIRGLDTVGVVYVLNKSESIPSLKEIEQLELIVSFGSSDQADNGRELPPTQAQPFRVVGKSSPAATTPPGATPIRMFGFALNPESERMEMDGNLISLSPTEFLLMHTLASSPEQPVSAIELMDRCWTKDSRPADNAVDVAIFRLRKKLNKTDSGKGLIKTVRGSGYMFIPPTVNADSPVVAD